MNAMYRLSISTTPKTVFQSSDHPIPGHDIPGCTVFYVTNHASPDDAIDVLVRVEGHHTAVEHAPDGFGAAPAESSQWFPVPPGATIPFSVAKDTAMPGIAIRKVELKASSGTVEVSFGVGQRR